MFKFRTIDVEGDCSADDNKRLFPQGNHFDPDTIMWCVTFCDQDYNTLTLVKKLPEVTRKIHGIRESETRTFHCRDSRVPQELDGHTIIEFTDWKEFLVEITWQIMISERLYCKAYGRYNYDWMALNANYERNNMKGSELLERYVMPVNTTKWEETHNQVKKGQWIDNQSYMVNGIRHNIEDAIQLARRINNKEVK